MIRFVTTFDDVLYAASAKRFIRTFVDIQTIGALSCFYEPPMSKELFRTQKTHQERLELFDISVLNVLNEWDAKYRAACEKQNTYWNRRAWQWFRKSASLRTQIEENDEKRWMFWIDCDCEFVKQITPEFLEDLTQGAAVTHLKGQRKWTEGGIVIFDMESKKGDPREFILKMGECYDSGEFMKFERWDDSWIVDQIRKRYPPEMFCDIADPAEESLRVVDTSPLGEYIIHHKGSHIRARVK